MGHAGVTAVAEPTLAMPRVGSAARVRWAARVATVAFLSAVAWAAHFAGWRQLGFFSDDHTFAVSAMTWTPAETVRQMQVLLFSYPEPQGRPLGFLLGIGLPFAGYEIAGVFGMYAVGWAVLSLNAGLLYGLLARRLPRPMPLVGSLMFLLYPADTTRPFLCHAHILQPSITFALVSAHLLMRRSWRWRWMAYPVAALCLVTYETALLPLLAVPLLAGRRGVRSWAVHLGLLAGLIGLVAITRSIGGENRAVESTGGAGVVLAHLAIGSVRGPLAVADCCWKRPGKAALAAFTRPGLAAVILLASAACAVAVGLASRRVPSTAAIRRAAVFGLAAVGVSYLLSFTHYPPADEEGQSTSVHTAAAIGTATVAAAAVGGLLRRSRPAGVAAAAVYFGLLAGSAWDEQGAYADLWHRRQAFWRQVVDLCPDLARGTVVLCDGEPPHATAHLPVTLWSDAMVPQQLFVLPSDCAVLPPVVAAYPRTAGHDWQSAVGRRADGRVVWRTVPCGCQPGRELVEGNTILLRCDSSGRVTRIAGSVDLDGRPFRAKPPPPPGGRAAYPHQPFYRVLLGGED